MMKTLNQQCNLEKYISELKGYLVAISHLNDCPETRHGFYADLIYLHDIEPKEAAEKFINYGNIEFSSINLRDELKIINKYIFHNFMLGIPLDESDKLNFIKEQLGWHIQDYITIGTQEFEVINRFAYTQETPVGQTTHIFTHIEKYLIVMAFKYWEVQSVT